MALDIAGMLTGVSNQPVNPNLSVQQQQLAMGANATNMMQGGMESMRRSAGGSVPMAEQLAMAMSQLDLSNPADLAKLAKIQQATGDLAGAAQTASKINAMQQAKIDETRAVARESRASETFTLGKEDRDAGKLRDVANEKRAIAQEKRAVQTQVLRKEQAARTKAASEKAISTAETVTLQEANLRTMYKNHAISKGKTELAEQIALGMSLKKVEELLYKTSTAVITALKSKEEDVYNQLINTPAMQAAIPKLLTDATSWYHIGKLSEAQEDAIYFKTKEISIREQLPIDKAMLKAMKVLSDLEVSPQTDAEIEAARLAEEQNALLNGGPPDDDSDKDSFGNIKK